MAVVYACDVPFFLRRTRRCGSVAQKKPSDGVTGVYKLKTLAADDAVVER